MNRIRIGGGTRRSDEKRVLWDVWGCLCMWVWVWIKSVSFTIFLLFNFRLNRVMREECKRAAPKAAEQHGVIDHWLDPILFFFVFFFFAGIHVYCSCLCVLSLSFPFPSPCSFLSFLLVQAVLSVPGWGIPFSPFVSQDVQSILVSIVTSTSTTTTTAAGVTAGDAFIWMIVTSITATATVVLAIAVVVVATADC